MKYTIDLQKFWHDPYPDLVVIQRMAPVVYVQQLDAALITPRIDIFTQEKRIDLFSSHQPDGLITQLMGENMMRKDGFEHQEELRQIFLSLSPRTIVQVWKTEFERSTQAVIEGLKQKQVFDLLRDFSMPVSGAALVAITGLRQMKPVKMDQVSQAMIDGCSNYIGTPSVTQACRAATINIDAHIAQMIPELTDKPDTSALSVLIQADQSMTNIQSNIKPVISGGQNEPRDAIAGTAAALLIHPNALRKVLQSGDWGQAFLEYARWMSPVGMSPRRISQDCEVLGYDFKKNDRVFFMFGAANRDPAFFVVPEIFDVSQ